jgi:ribosomal protein S8E
MQQVAQALNKDSAFQLVTLNSLKEWWRNIVVQATALKRLKRRQRPPTPPHKQPMQRQPGRQPGRKRQTPWQPGANSRRDRRNGGKYRLAGAFRLVGAAIKSIPVFGWILTGISALVGLFAVFSSKAREAKKAQEEFSKALIEGAYKPIGTIESLSVAYKQLGDNLDAKKKFIEQNKKAFDELGVAVNDVADAENLLVKNKDAFIDAQIAKAKAAVYLQQSMEKVKKQMQLEQEIAKMSDTKTVYASYGMYGGGGYSYETENTAKTKKKKELEELTAEIKQGYQNAANEELNGYNILKNAGINGTDTYKAGTVGAIEQAISQKQAALKLLTSNADYKKGLAEIAALQKQLEGITGKPKTSGSGSANKDPFLENWKNTKRIHPLQQVG